VPGYTLDDRPAGVLKNKLGATSYEQLEPLEAQFVAARYSEIQLGHGPTGQFDAVHLKAIHRHLFQDVYEWAGHSRDERVRLADGTVATEPLLRKVDGSAFLDGPHVPQALDRVAKTIREADYLRGLSRQQFTARAADIMAEVNGIHAFREGNGRTQRVFMEELAKQAGHTLDFNVVSRQRMVQACIAAIEQGDPAMMRRMFDEISNPRRVAAVRAAIDALDRHGFAWNDHYVATMEPGHPVEVTLAGVAGEHFMARTGAEILIGNTADLPDPRPERGDTFTFMQRSTAGSSRPVYGNGKTATHSATNRSKTLRGSGLLAGRSSIGRFNGMGLMRLRGGEAARSAAQAAAATATSRP
jgi:cell filamentation protein